MDIENIVKTLNQHKEELDNLGITVQKVIHQLEKFASGISYADIVKPCGIGNGIFKLTDSKHDELIQLYHQAAISGRLMKFVPASGAATRMFSKLQTYLNHSEKITLSGLRKDAVSDSSARAVLDFINGLENFAFFDELKSLLTNSGYDFKKLNENDDIRPIIRKLINEDGMNYSFYPKGAIAFHKYEDRLRTAFEEHIYEASQLVADQFNNVNIHFTISREHEDIFQKSVNKTINDLRNEGFNIILSYSYQEKSTDTISVTFDNKPFLNNDGKLVFRPAGHGALIENLNNLSGDLIIIKNIDNILPSTKNAVSLRYAKILTGFLISVQKEIFSYLRVLEKQKVNDSLITEIKKFAVEYLSLHIPQDFDKQITDNKAAYLFTKLNRPIRVCGMVKNEDHPGGGPFWVRNSGGEISLQIVEESQINKSDPVQLKLFQSATHFNPVDMICAVKNFKGRNFDLKKYVDENSGLITTKTYQGKELKALELPGLWNGGMSDWNTLFVEIPSETFNPVKEITDLLKPAHQVQVAFIQPHG